MSDNNKIELENRLRSGCVYLQTVVRHDGGSRERITEIDETSTNLLMLVAAAEITRLTAENERLQAIVSLAKLLVQPTDDGPQLVGHKRFRDALHGAVHGLTYTDPRDEAMLDLDEARDAARTLWNEGWSHRSADRRGQEILAWWPWLKEEL